VDAAAGDVVEARETILLLEFTAVPVGRVRHDQAADKKTVRCGVAGRHALTRATCSYFVWRSMRGQPQFPHTSLIPFPPVTSKANVGSECLEFKGRDRVERKS
jgi:hypothetical protein